MLTPRQLEAAAERHPLLVLRALRRLARTSNQKAGYLSPFTVLYAEMYNAAKRAEGVFTGVGKRLQWTDADLQALAREYPVCLRERRAQQKAAAAE